jgi:hypothetical protein
MRRTCSPCLTFLTSPKTATGSTSKTNEYGLYTSFVDDGRDKTYKSFYRSDRNFEAEIYLDHLGIDEHI